MHRLLLLFMFLLTATTWAQDVTQVQPSGTVYATQPSIRATFKEDIESAQIWIDGTEFTGRAQTGKNFITVRPHYPLDFGTHRVMVVGRGYLGEKLRGQWEFSIVNRPPPAPSNQSNSFFENVWVDHNVTQKGQKGMRIHLRFVANGRLNRQCEASVFFYFSSGKPLRDFDNKYYSQSGDVVTWEKFTPKYDSARYNDLKLFIPYDQLHMKSGDHRLKLKAKLYDKGARQTFAESGFVNFTFNK